MGSQWGPAALQLAATAEQALRNSASGAAEEVSSESEGLARSLRFATSEYVRCIADMLGPLTATLLPGSTPGSSSSSSAGSSNNSDANRGELQLLSLLTCALKQLSVQDHGSQWEHPHKVLCSIQLCARRAVEQQLSSAASKLQHSSSGGESSSSGSSNEGSGAYALLAAAAPWLVVWARSIQLLGSLLGGLLSWHNNASCHLLARYSLVDVGGICLVVFTLHTGINELAAALHRCSSIAADVTGSSSSSSSGGCMWQDMYMCSRSPLAGAYWSNLASWQQQQEQQQVELQGLLQQAHQLCRTAVSRGLRFQDNEFYKETLEYMLDKANPPAAIRQQQQKLQQNRQYKEKNQAVAAAVSVLHSAATAPELWERLQQSIPAQLPQLVGVHAAALCAQLPVPYCCNNPSCTNCVVVSELQLVSRRACICGGCRVVRYCSSDCQRSHWQQHKPVCRCFKQQQQQQQQEQQQQQQQI